MPPRPEDICPEPPPSPPGDTTPLSPPLHLSSVYRCDSPQQAESLLTGELEGYVYSRDGHPAADQLAEKCRALHDAEAAVVTASGMAAMATVCLSQLTSGDHIVVSGQLYGASLDLLTNETSRFGVTTTVVDTCDRQATADALQENTKLLIVETITNPLLRVSDIAALAAVAHEQGAQLVVDNTLASPLVCRPLALGADWVVESVTKIMNGHSDGCLGLVCGQQAHWQRVPRVLSRWGLTSSPMDCWLALRGLSTLALRAERAWQNAQRIAEWLEADSRVRQVSYPGLSGHPDHDLATKQFQGGYGSLVTFTLPGGRAAAERFIAAATEIPFCPSLGELSTTLSHPQSTSHRQLSEPQRQSLGISGGTIRLSLGIESAETIQKRLEAPLAAAATDV